MTDKCYDCGEEFSEDWIEYVEYNESKNMVYQSIKYRCWNCETVQFFVSKFVFDSKSQFDENMDEVEE